ncbi:Na+/H+ antiporter NhaC, partial [Nocardioides guangzhouensis]
MLDALLPIVVLIALLALTIIVFGIDATNGPLQVALLLSAAFASLMAFKNGYTVAGVAEAAVGGVTSAVGAIFILLAVGALIGTWNMAGTIPTIVDYGIQIVSPTWFYVTAAVVCALVGMVTGSSWTTAGTLGVAFVGMASVMGLSEATAAGAVICGAYFGDKMTPLSETTILVPRLVGGGLTVGEHVRNMFWTAGPALGISLVIFFFLGLNADPDAAISTDAAREALAQAFNISFLNLLPLLLLVLFAVLKFPPFLSILGSALFAGILALFTQWDAVKAFVDNPDYGPFLTGVHAVFAAMATGFVSDSGVEPIDDLFSRGGMASLLTTIWLVLGALSFAAVMEHAGFLQRLLEPIVSRARSRGSLILAVNSSGIGLNVIAGDQYVADVLPARMFRGEFARRGLAPQVLSRAVEDSGTVTSVLVPWNTCGAYI